MRKLFSSLCLFALVFTSQANALLHYNENGSPDYEKINQELISQQQEEDKMYIDDEEMKSTPDSFHVHLGNNVWVRTNTVHRDKHGLFTYKACIAKSMLGAKYGYEKSWKCPYCYKYWPIGTPCQNKDCPSRYGK